MKKLLVTLGILTSISAYSLNTTAKIGYTQDLLKLSNGEKVSASVPTFALEMTQSFLIGEFGFGTMYTKGSVDKNIPDTFPPYALAKIYTFPILVKPYIVGKIGYNSKNSENQKFGGYYAGGVGMTLTSLELEVLYSVMQNKIDKDSNLGQVTATVGYKF